MPINLNGFGYNESVDVTAVKTLAEVDNGYVQNVKASVVITLPATIAGQSFIVRIGKEGLTVAISPAAVDKLMGGGVTKDTAGTTVSSADNKDYIFTNQPAGSFIEFNGDGVNGFYVRRLSGVCFREV